MRWTKRARLSTACALEWLVECVRSSKDYDISHLIFGEDPLTEDEMLTLAKRLRAPITCEEDQEDDPSPLSGQLLEARSRVMEHNKHHKSTGNCICDRCRSDRTFLVGQSGPEFLTNMFDLTGAKRP